MTQSAILHPANGFFVARMRGQGGFTLIELIMVVVLLGVLAVFAAPRLINAGDFFSRGLHDQTLSYLRYAQKTAIAQRRTVCVVFGGNTLTLTISSAPALICDTPLAGPSGEAQLLARGAAVYDTAPAPISFNFNGLGQPVNAAGVVIATQTFRVATLALTITVQGVTGYVY